MRAAAVALLVALLALPTAAALDLFPGHERFEAKEARVLVRLPQGGTLTVTSDAAVDVALAHPGGAPGPWQRAPAQLRVEALAPEDSWHGLSGTVEVVVKRAQRSQEVRFEVDDGSGFAAEFEWPPARRIPSPAAAPLLLALFAAAALRPCASGRE